jgi:hypothetical protein
VSFSRSKIAAQGARPRVEELEGLGPGFHLRPQVVGHHVREAAAQAVPRLGLRVHEGLGLLIGGRGAAFDRIRRQGERGAAEADQWHSAVQFLSQQTDGLEHVAERFSRLEGPEPVDITGLPDRVIDRRPLTLDEIEVEAHRRERHQQIREQDGGVDVDGVHRLQGDRNRKLRLPADLEERVALAKRPVLGHIAARLAHEPDGRGVHRFAPAGAEKSIVHRVVRLRARSTRSSSHKGLNRTDACRCFSSACRGSGRK